MLQKTRAVQDRAARKRGRKISYASPSRPLPVRIALLSDVHANLQALQAVLAELDRRAPDVAVCLGDVVGYNADPKACLDLVRSRCQIVLRGNHDEAVATGDVRGLPRDGALAAKLHHNLLDEDDRAWLGTLPLIATLENCTLVHATPQEPERWLRVESYQVAHAQFDHFTTPLCFAGHTHSPGVMGQKVGQFQVRPDGRFFVNVGSVGQPRDGNPRACVAFFDTETFAYELVRLPYHVEGARQRIEDVGLPRTLSDRLRTGR